MASPPLLVPLSNNPYCLFAPTQFLLFLVLASYSVVAELANSQPAPFPCLHLRYPLYGALLYSISSTASFSLCCPSVSSPAAPLLYCFCIVIINVYAELPVVSLQLADGSCAAGACCGSAAVYLSPCNYSHPSMSRQTDRQTDRAEDMY